MIFPIILTLFIAVCYFRFKKARKECKADSLISVSGGWQAARKILDHYYYYDFPVERHQGRTRFDPWGRRILLSDSDYRGRSVWNAWMAISAAALARQYMLGNGWIYAIGILEKAVGLLSLISLLFMSLGQIPAMRDFYFWGGALALIFLFCAVALGGIYRKAFFDLDRDLSDKKLFQTSEMTRLAECRRQLSQRYYLGSLIYWIGGEGV